MSSSSSAPKGGFRNVPPPAGSKTGSAYTRFIPREELGDFASWRPGAFGDPGADGAAATAAAEPPQEDWAARLKAARQAGYQDGYRDGTAALDSFKQHFAAQATAQVGALLDAFDQQFAELDERVAQALARAAAQIARQVVRSELQQRPQLVADVAVEAVAALMLSARHITVRVPPQDLPLVAEGAEEALAARGARLQADATIERGGVRVESDVGAIDAGIAARWAQAAATLDGRVAWDDDFDAGADAPRAEAP